LFPELHQFRADFETVKKSLKIPLGSIRKFQKRLDLSNNKIWDLQQKNRELEQKAAARLAQEVGYWLQSSKELNASWHKTNIDIQERIEGLNSALQEKENEISRLLQQNTKPHRLEECQKNSLPLNSAQDLAIFDQNKIVKDLSDENADLQKQLQDARRERDDKLEQWLKASQNEKSVRNIFAMNEGREGKLKQRNDELEQENNWLRQAQSSNTLVTARHGVFGGTIQNSSMTRSSNTQASPRQVFAAGSLRSSSFDNRARSTSNATRHPSTGSLSNPRRSSTTTASSRPRPRLTNSQKYVINQVQLLRDDQLALLDDAFQEVRTIKPGEGTHWVKGVRTAHILFRCCKLI
jgi:hypothetical protein